MVWQTSPLHGVEISGISHVMLHGHFSKLRYPLSPLVFPWTSMNIHKKYQLFLETVIYSSTFLCSSSLAGCLGFRLLHHAPKSLLFLFNSAHGSLYSGNPVNTLFLSRKVFWRMWYRFLEFTQLSVVWSLNQVSLSFPAILNVCADNSSQQPCKYNSIHLQFCMYI